MRSVRLFQSGNVVRVCRPFWNSHFCRELSSTVDKGDNIEPDPYEGNFSFVDCDQYTKVTVIGAAGRVGKTLSLLLKTCPLVDHICLFDTDKAVKGVGVDISHIDTKCCVSYVCGMRNIQQALDGPDVVVIAAGCPTSPTLTGNKLFDKNAPIVAGLSEACARFCPKACVVLITNPINSLLPVMGEVYQIITNKIPTRKLFGLTALDVVRANTFVAEVVRKDPNSIIVPVIGGTSQDTIVPVFSQMKPYCKIKRGELLALTECLKRAEGNLADCQNCGTRGSSSLSTAYAAFRFTSSLVMALKGAENIIECAYVQSDIIPELEYMASPLRLGIRGIEHNFGYPRLSDCETCVTNAPVPTSSLELSFKEDTEKVPDEKGDYRKTDAEFCPSYLTGSLWNSSLHKTMPYGIGNKRNKVSYTCRAFHTVHKSSRRWIMKNIRQRRLNSLAEEERKNARNSVKSDHELVTFKTNAIREVSNKKLWDLKFKQTHYKMLNATAKQKVRSFNCQRKLGPSASALFLLERNLKKQAEKSLVPTYGKVEKRSRDKDEVKYTDSSEEKQLILAKKKDEDRQISYRDFVLKQLQELKKENDELKRKIGELVKKGNLESSIQVQSDRLELEKTKLKACWLVMSSTIEAFNNFLKKFTPKADSRLISLSKPLDSEEEVFENAMEFPEENQKDLKKDKKYDDKYYNYLEKLMQDQVEGEKSRSRLAK